MSGRDDFEARVKRVQARSGRLTAMPSRPRRRRDEVDETAMIAAVLRPQLALILGAAALILGRSIAMNQLMLVPKVDVLGWGEGGIVLMLLVVIGFLFGKSDIISHCALVFGAALAFLLEGYYIPLFPSLMGAIYNPGYVALVTLHAQ